MMKQRFFSVCMAVMMACTAFGQNIIKDYAQLTKQGEMPPAWLKNKLTQAQYDSLVPLSKYYAVSYNHFKQRNLSRQQIQRYVMIMAKALDAKSLKNLEQKTDTTMFTIVPGTVAVHPLALATADSTADARYIVFSDMDGYDAHVMLEVKKLRTKADGTTLLGMKLIPYSLSGLKVELVEMKLQSTVKSASEKGVRIESDSKNLSSPYDVFGLLRFEDGMGYVHTVLVNQRFYLKDK